MGPLYTRRLKNSSLSYCLIFLFLPLVSPSCCTFSFWPSTCAVCAPSLCGFLFFATLWTVAHQVPLSLGFPRQEYWSGLPFPSPGDLPDPGIISLSLVSPALQEDFLPAEPPGKVDLMILVPWGPFWCLKVRLWSPSVPPRFQSFLVSLVFPFDDRELPKSPRVNSGLCVHSENCLTALPLGHSAHKMEEMWRRP